MPDETVDIFPFYKDYSSSAPQPVVNVGERPKLGQLRLYDEAVHDWVKLFNHPEVNNGHPMRVVVFATPDRAYAEVRNITKRDPQDPKRTYTLPMVWITRMDMPFDQTRWERSIIRKIGFYDQDKSEIYQARYPMPYDIRYQVDFWARNRTTLNLMQEWVALQFDHFEFFRPIDFSRIHPQYRCYIVPFENDGILDTSELEVGEGDDRALRFTVTLKCRAWLFRPVRLVKTVKKVIYDKMESPYGIPYTKLSDDPGGIFLETHVIPLVEP